MMKLWQILSIAILMLVFSTFSYAADNNAAITQLNAKISQSQTRLQAVEKLNDGIARDLLAANEQLSYAVANEQTGKNEYARISGELDNALRSHYSDPAAVSRLQQQKNAAWQVYLKEQSTTNTARGKVSALEKQRNDYDSERQRLMVDINNSKAELFDIEFKTPVWVEGYGEAVMTKTISHADCENVAVQTARRDALERAGLTFISSLTVVENNQVVKDEIKASIKAVILNQDFSSGYGTPKFEINSDYGKYTVKIRVQVQNTSDYNPYRNIIAGNSYENTKPVAVPVNIPVQSQATGRIIQESAPDNTLFSSRQRNDSWLGFGFGVIGGASSTINWTSPNDGTSNYANNFQRRELSGLALDGGVKFNNYFAARANFSYFASRGDVYAQYDTMWLSNGSVDVAAYKIAAQLIAACPMGELVPYIGLGAGVNVTTTALAYTYGAQKSDLPNSGTTTFYLPISAGIEWVLIKDASVVADYTYNYNIGSSADQFAQLAPPSQISGWLRWYF
ncbi:MAG: hypothetical protein WCP79_11190 [Bacillota bacterium]